ncbi:unnamed protein product [Peniophora sp. CBMAI 1063]|nr:unnamed protein product [Peniophora sp. CBMAI 1063]
MIRDVERLEDCDRFDDKNGKEGQLETERKVHWRLRAVKVIPHSSGDADDSRPRTRTDRYLPYACAGVTVFSRRHYYYAVTEIGRPLNSFRSTFELTRAISGSITAHKQAYEKANLLHRDISPGNILITEKGTGLLIDWESAKRINVDKARQPRMEWKVRTSQFHSLALHRNSDKLTHDLRDDLESFLWVLLYMIVHLRPLNLDPTTMLFYLHSTFDVTLAYKDKEGRTLYHGGDKKLSFLRGETNSFANPTIFERRVPYPLRKLLFDLADIFGPIYPAIPPTVRAHEEDFVNEVEAVPNMPKHLYAGLDSEDAMALKEEWRQKHLAERAKAPAPAAPHPLLKQLQESNVNWAEPVIDYTKVNDHAAIMEAFTDALMSDTSTWFKADAADDQLPSLRQFKIIQPNAVNGTPLNGSSQRRPAGSSSKNRPPTESSVERSSKRIKVDGMSSPARAPTPTSASVGPDVGRRHWEEMISERVTRPRAGQLAAAGMGSQVEDEASDEEDDDVEDSEGDDEGTDSGYQPSR